KIFCLFVNKKKKIGSVKYIQLPMNAISIIKCYRSILNPFYKKLQNQNPEIDFKYEGDNAPSHISKIARNWIIDNDINHTPFGGYPVNEIGGKPANSPDLSPIEYVFASWNQSLSKVAAINVNQLIKTIISTWKKIHLE